MDLLILRQNGPKSLARCGLLNRNAPPTILNFITPRYGPRQSKSSSYHEIGRLSVEVKFAPFSSLVRRVPIRVRGYVTVDVVILTLFAS